MKKRFFTVSLIAICLSILAYGSYAFEATSEVAHNVITSSGVDIVLEEKQLDENGELVDYPNKPIPVMPTTEVSKIVSVKNMQAESYIRVRFDVVIANGKGVEFQTDSTSSGTVYHKTNTAKPIITLSLADSGWTLKDGWWYFNTSVKTGDSTTALFTQVNFDGPNMTNEYQDKTVTVNVYAQAVQTANNKAENPWEALGWPEES